MKKIKWYINRAKIMNRKEIIHRILCKKYDKKIQSGYRLKEENYSLNFIELPKFNGIDENTDKIILNSCDKILNNKIDIFNMTLDLNYEDKFLKDPFSRKLWSKELYTKIDFRGDDLVGDPKIIWEINKQQYLLDLGIAYRITGDEKYAEKVIDEINEWINQNPLYIGINWTSNLEIALRCLTWIFSLSLIKQYVEKNNVCISNISHYLRCKSNFIYNKLSLYSSANNHLIGELTLLLYSSFFIECNESDQWRKKSISMLNEQVKKQFYSDGINKEQSINYQIHTMELYFLCQYLLDINNMKLNEDTIEVLKKACFYLNKLSIKNGDIFNIGDEDGGHILRLQNKSSSVLQILQFASILLEDNYIYEGKDKYIDYKILMLFGNKYLSFLESNLKFKNNSEKTYIFNEGGMYIRDGKLNNISYKCMLDFGNIGMAPLNAHAHCDILSFNLNLDQQSFLIDCGTYKYHKDDGFRDYFRGVGAHNTISIDDENQFAFLGKFMCSKSPNTRIN